MSNPDAPNPTRMRFVVEADVLRPIGRTTNATVERIKGYLQAALGPATWPLLIFNNVTVTAEPVQESEK